MRILAILATIATIFFGMVCATAEPISPNAISVDDGDTIRVGAKVYRLVGFDTPETQRAKCSGERALGDRATVRLQNIVRMGGLDLIEIECSCRPGTHGTRSCNYGRLCATLKAKGEDVGKILIREGLARPFHCGKQNCPKRQGWC